MKTKSYQAGERTQNHDRQIANFRAQGVTILSANQSDGTFWVSGEEKWMSPSSIRRMIARRALTLEAAL
jgi:hypothetical protein